LGGLRIVALHGIRRRGLGIAKIHRGRIELDHHLPHLRHLAARRHDDDAERLRAARARRQQTGKHDADRPLFL